MLGWCLGGRVGLDGGLGGGDRASTRSNHVAQTRAAGAASQVLCLQTCLLLSAVSKSAMPLGLPVPFFETNMGHRVLSLEHASGIVGMIWPQCMPHGNKRQQSEDVSLPILMSSVSNAALFQHNIKSMWEEYGCVAVLLNESAATRAAAERQFLEDMRTVGAKYGPCRRCQGG